MNTFTRIFCIALFLFPSWLVGTPIMKDVYVYIHELDHRWDRYYDHSIDEDNSIVFKAEVMGALLESSAQIEEDKHWYHFRFQREFIENLNHFTFRGRKILIEVPLDLEPSYITILNENLIPNGINVLDKQTIRSLSRPHRIKIKGEIAIDPEQKVPNPIKLHLPFDPWVEENNSEQSFAEAEIDWQYASFNFQYNSIYPTIGFISFNDRYYPVFLEPGDHYRFRWDLIEDSGNWKRVRCCDNHHHHYNANAREFFRQRFENGLSRAEYRELTNAFIGNRINRQDTLIAWSRAIVPYYKEGHNNPDRLLSYINDLGKLDEGRQFEEAYETMLDRQNAYSRHIYHRYEGLLILGLMASLILFAIMVVMRLIGHKIALDKYINWSEAALFVFICANILFHALIWPNHGYTNIASISAWALFLVPMLIFYPNMRFLVPNLLARKKWWRYLGILGVASVVLFFCAAILNQLPYLSYDFILVQGKTIVLKNSGYHGYRGSQLDVAIPMHLIGLVIAPIYGLGRNLILKRVPKLQQQKVALDAELNTLKSQVSPHFFFNSLNTVYGFALSEESPKTAEAITKLSDLMRFAIYHGRRDFVPLEKELDYLSDYIELQRLRLNPVRHILRYRVDGEPGDLEIAPLLLITLIENAFKHGISMSKDSFIHIDLLIQTDGLILTVENSVHPGQLEKVIEGEEREGGLGLSNAQQRLDLMYTGKYEWHIEEQADRYFTQLSLDLR